MSSKLIRLLLAIVAVSTLILISVDASYATAINHVYDDLNRLIRVEYGDGKVITYEYDEVGNRTEKSTEQLNAIVATAGSNGTTDFPGVFIAEDGQSKTYTFTADDGYHISDVKIDGVSVGAVSSYTFTNITENHTIEVEFSDIYVAVSAGLQGSITPSGNVYVTYGANKTFTITPLPGATIADVLVDGDSVGAAPTYTFSDVTENHTISATFTCTAAYPVRVIGSSTTYYSTVQAAYNAAADGNTIQCLETNLTGDLDLNRSVSVSLEGGYYCNFTGNTGRMTFLKGMVQTQSGAGTVTIENITITQ